MREDRVILPPSRLRGVKMAKKSKSQKPKTEVKKLYSVISLPEQFRRSGILFTKQPTYLSEDEITEAILKEPKLVVEEVKEKPQK